MRRVRAVLAVLAGAAACASPAAAEPLSFPHGSADYRFTTTQPGAPTGWAWDGVYHAAGDPQGYPPYMRQMTFFHPPGMVLDTSVPAACKASDIELAVRGPDACPPDSRIGGGTVWISFMGGLPRPAAVDTFNNTNEQIIVGRSPGLASIVRARIQPDGSIEYRSPTCYPSVPPAGCPVDNALQVKSSMRADPYTRTGPDGSVRSYLTTPPDCPPSGHWESVIKWWWADGTADTVVTEQPCAAAGPA